MCHQKLGLENLSQEGRHQTTRSKFSPCTTNHTRKDQRGIQKIQLAENRPGQKRHIDCRDHPSTGKRQRQFHKITMETTPRGRKSEKNGMTCKGHTTVQQLVKCTDTSYWSCPKWATRSTHQEPAQKSLPQGSRLMVYTGQCDAITTATNPKTIQCNWYKLTGIQKSASRYIKPGNTRPVCQQTTTSTSMTSTGQGHTTQITAGIRGWLEESMRGYLVLIVQNPLQTHMAGTFNPEILIFNATMADIPLKTSYSPNRWREGLNVMLEKSLGNFNVEKLRIILLFEVDFNANNKWTGWAVMRHAESLNLLAEEQYGSRKHKAAVLQCFNKGLFYDMLWQGKWPAALCSNNAKSCYDRITLLAAALSLCRLGATTPAVQSMLSTIHGMHHHIHTAFGDSTPAAGRTTWNTPIAGIGQGNRAGPSIWAAVSLPMFDIMRQDRFYALLMGAISQIQWKITGFAFVDDTNLCHPHIRQWQASGSTNATHGHPLGWTTMGYRWRTHTRKMFLVPGRL